MSILQYYTDNTTELSKKIRKSEMNKSANKKYLKYFTFKILIIFYFLFLLSNTTCFSQGQVVFNNDPYLVISNGAYLVIDNSATNAITTLGTGGNIISESELNRVKWNIGTNTGVYTIPFSQSVGNKIPLSVNITVAGTGAGNIMFSTYGNTSWDNATYMPSDVTNMSNINLINNSAFVMDRFWEVDAVNYTTKPTPIILFTYIDAEWSAAGNTMNEPILFAQRFNPAPTNKWDWLGPFGTANIVSNTVSSGSVAPTDFHRSWTLVDQGSPLPIEMTNFNAICDKGRVHLIWTTVSENNNDYFSIEKSIDGVNYTVIGIVQGAGTSSAIINYQFIDSISLNNEVKYYRLKQTDYNGESKYSEIIASNCINSDNNNNIDKFDIISIYPNPNKGNFTVTINSLISDKASIIMYDMLGQKVMEQNFYITKGINNHKINVSLSRAMYNIELRVNNGYKIIKQIVIE